MQAGRQQFRQIIQKFRHIQPITHSHAYIHTHMHTYINTHTQNTGRQA